VINGKVGGGGGGVGLGGGGSCVVGGGGGGVGVVVGWGGGGKGGFGGGVLEEARGEHKIARWSVSKKGEGRADRELEGGGGGPETLGREVRHKKNE